MDNLLASSTACTGRGERTLADEGSGDENGREKGSTGPVEGLWRCRGEEGASSEEVGRPTLCGAEAGLDNLRSERADVAEAGCG